jgi:hypothetical protein
MTKKEQFSDEEWAKVAALPGLVVIGAGMSDGHKLPAVREIRAGGEALTAGLARYPENAILQALTEAQKEDGGDATHDADTSAQGSVDGFRESLAASIAAGVDILRARVTVDEFEQIGEVLIECARSVVERLGTGFMGSGNDKVDPGEREFVDGLISAFQLGGPTGA